MENSKAKYRIGTYVKVKTGESRFIRGIIKDATITGNEITYIVADRFSGAKLKVPEKNIIFDHSKFEENYKIEHLKQDEKIINMTSTNNKITPLYKPGIKVYVKNSKNTYIQGIIEGFNIINSIIVYKIRTNNGIPFNAAEEYVYPITGSDNTVFNNDEEDYGDEG